MTLLTINPALQWFCSTQGLCRTAGSFYWMTMLMRFRTGHAVIFNLLRKLVMAALLTSSGIQVQPRAACEAALVRCVAS